MHALRPDRISLPILKEPVVLESCRFFMDVQVWPAFGRLMPNEWLGNFTATERPYAVQILASFHYFADPMIDQMLRQAVISLYSELLPQSVSLQNGIQEWEDLMKKTIVTRVTGEIPSDTDSGFHYMRRARQVLGFSETTVMSPENAIARVANGHKGIVLFLDDFVGSGKQCIETWTRNYSGRSFQSIASNSQVKFYYCPLICTQKGKEAIERNCTHLALRPLHFLPHNYSLLASDSIFWPDTMRKQGQQIIYEASMRAGISSLEWRGFHDLGLALAMGDSIPDACLPILYYDNGTWSPLMRRL